MPDRVGVLVMAHGTPPSPDGIEEFYTRIRRGRAPSASQLAELEGRYRAIGGTSPLAARTRAQVEGLRRLLDERGEREGRRYLVGYGAKHTEPFIEDAAAALLEERPGLVVTLVLTPHRSSLGSDEYHERAAAALGDHVAVVAIRQWHDQPGFVSVLAERVEATVPAPPERTVVVFTAHSLPQRVLEGGDPYADQVAASAEAVARHAGVESWRVAWQSAGRTPEPWIGPDILEVIERAPAEGVETLVVCPIGFVADHLEVLYDLDVEARAVADRVGVTLRRTPSLNDDPKFLAALADVVGEAAGARTPAAGGTS